jgi:MiaB-like tRNA modifying enzyme
MKLETFYIETFGCSANQNSSEIMAGMLVSHGFIQVNNEELADIIILNTCVVKEKTESKIKRRIQDLKEFSGKKLLVVAGCMPQIEMKKIRNLNKSKNVMFLGTFHVKDILNLIRDFKEGKLDEKKQLEYISENKEIKLCMPKIPGNKLISIQQISEGCLGNCSFCRTRLAKGKLFSYPEDMIIKSIEGDLNSGAKEVWITSQDNAAYGIDINGKSRLIELLKRILELKGKFRIRLGMMDINNLIPIAEDLLELFKDKKMYKFLHIPVQSASNKILSDMNRFYKIEEAEKIIEKFRGRFKFGVIATDIIVGYPTETEEDHKFNLDFIRKYKPEVLNLSKFSSHKGTVAGKLKVLANAIVHKRARELMEEHRRTARERKEEYIKETGKEIRVFVNKKIENSEKLCECRDENYNIVLVKCGREFLGKEINVKIAEIGVHHMIGEQI